MLPLAGGGVVLALERDGEDAVGIDFRPRDQELGGGPIAFEVLVEENGPEVEASNVR